MPNYQIRLLETRLTTDGADDVALFDITRQENERTWRVPVYLSPLFRVLRMEFQPPVESRREMVAGLGARALAERLEQGEEPPYEEPLVLGTQYPGAPGDPDPLATYDQLTVTVRREKENPSD